MGRRAIEDGATDGCGAGGTAEGYESDGEDLSPRYWEGRDADEDTVLGVSRSVCVSEGGGRSPAVAVREGNWKLLVNADGAGASLYDLAADPNEAKELAATRPEVARRLSELAITWRKSLP